jgi:phosphoglycolate phosphatase-like HAD superfamily hydrolase
LPCSWSGPAFTILAGLIANDNTYPGRRGLPDTFEAQVLGLEHGFEKPGPTTFTWFANRLAIDERYLSDVGDAQDDVAGGNGGGATSMFIHRVGSSVNPAWMSVPDCQIGNLEQIDTLLG